jgi:hypothetical protein
MLPGSANPPNRRVVLIAIRQNASTGILAEYVKKIKKQSK